MTLSDSREDKSLDLMLSCTRRTTGLTLHFCRLVHSAARCAGIEPVYCNLLYPDVHSIMLVLIYTLQSA